MPAKVWIGGSSMRRKVAVAVAICGFVTAVLTLGAAFLEYRNRNEEQRLFLVKQAKDAQDREDAVRAAAEAQRLQAERIAIQREEERHRVACQQNLDILSAAEIRFSTLRQEHGTFLQNVKDCVTGNRTDDRARNNCQAVICIGFDFIYRNTGISCAGTLLERDNVVREIRGVRDALVRDQCGPPTSPALEFMNY